MIRLNNKGQSLVLFVIIIPILLIVFTLIYDVGTAIYEKNKMSNINYMVVNYGLDNIENINENDLINMIIKNTDNLSNIYVNIQDNTIVINIKKEIKGVTGKIFNFNLTNINSEYKGYFEDNNKRIEKVR